MECYQWYFEWGCLQMKCYQLIERGSQMKRYLIRGDGVAASYNLNKCLYQLRAIGEYNNFIMSQGFEPEKVADNIEKKMIKNVLKKTQQQKRQQIFQYESQFLNEHPIYNHQNSHLINPHPPKINKSMVLSKQEAQNALHQIYTYYSKSYIQPTTIDVTQIEKTNNKKLTIQEFLLFARNFNIFKTIFTLERLSTIFKKHADYGKYLAFDNFYFMINSLSHQPEIKKFFNLQSMLQNLDIETIEQLEKQQFYNYLCLGSPQAFRAKFTDLFGSFNIKQKPRNSKLNYNYRKFSLPELKKKALPQPKEKKKNQKDFFILKNDREMQNNIFDEVKSIVVSWDSLRAKSVNNLGKPSQIVQKRFLKEDPQEDPYLQGIRPSTREGSKNNRSKQNNDKKKKLSQRVQQKIREIQEKQSIKNKQLLLRIEKKTQKSVNRKLKI